MNGFELLREIRKEYLESQDIFLTALTELRYNMRDIK